MSGDTGGRTRNSPRLNRRNSPEKFWRFVDKSAGPDSCWPWLRPVNDNGYGQFKLGGKNYGAHRLAWILTNGEVPGDLQLDHLCRVRHCCNPSHLEPVTIKENVLRGIGHSAENARKTHCPEGHPYTPANTKVVSGSRVCVTCSRRLARKRKAARAVLIAADPSLAEHGVVTTYSNWGCRCDLCKSAWANYIRDYHAERRELIAQRRRDRLEAGLLPHGRVSTYQAGCRCESCRAAKSADHRRSKTRGERAA